MVTTYYYGVDTASASVGHISSTIDLIKNAMKKDGNKTNMTLDNQNIIMQLGSLLLLLADSMEKPTRKSFAEELLGN